MTERRRSHPTGPSCVSAYFGAVTAAQSLLSQRRTLVAVLDRVRRLLGRAARADSIVEWPGVNGERVDAAVTAGESQWRVVFGCSTGTMIDWLEVFERPSRFDGVAGGRAILVNGPSGAGKSTLVRAIQQIAIAPFVVLTNPKKSVSSSPST